MITMRPGVVGNYICSGRGQLNFPNLSFDKGRHEYRYKDVKLPGITAKISKRLGKKFDGVDQIEEHRGQGSHVHDAIEAYVKRGELISVHPAAHWAIEQIKGWEARGFTFYSEVLVTDKTRYASAVDLLATDKDGRVHIFDTKAGNFMRDYVSLQLGVYRYFLEQHGGLKVHRCYCIATKDSDTYPVIPREADDILALLYS